MSNPRKDFDVKQILRIRWRWFGHPTSPPPTPANHPQGALFSLGGGRSCSTSRGTGGDQPSLGGCSSSTSAASASPSSGNSSLNINNNRKLGESAGIGGNPSAAAVGIASACPRSMSQQECRSSSPAPWIFPVHSRSSESLEPLQPQQEHLQAQNQQSIRLADARGPGDEDHNNNVESDSSSCRTSNSSVTLSSCVSMEPCVSEEHFQAHSHAEHTFRRMESYLRSRKLCDVVLLAGDRRIPAHRLVLSSVSDYFAAMFTSDVREAKQEEVKMEGRLELREDTIESLLSASSLLQLSAVVQACCSYLMKQLHPSNCLGIRSFADAQGCLDLQKVAHNYTMEHFIEVMRHQEFLLLPACEVEKLLGSDDMNVPEEETVVTALLSWVRHDVVTRQPHIPALLAHIRLPLLKPQVSYSSIHPSPILDAAALIEQLVRSVLYFVLNDGKHLKLRCVIKMLCLFLIITFPSYAFKE
ncbi:hypothetical protein DNTS_007783 [Danionella cerebrum]|uniref:BTB domain-containing protein n=1 Tax=Danionella cerebrum TaxID=2873325 RepID=A0A553RCU2_9TELE|nr:hypothetical protein DNTS_007783 [Danionella translucida]